MLEPGRSLTKQRFVNAHAVPRTEGVTEDGKIQDPGNDTEKQNGNVDGV